VAVLIVAVTPRAAEVDARLLGLHPIEWMHANRDNVRGWTNVTVHLGTGHGAHHEWPEIQEQLALIAAVGKVHYIPDHAGD
jgi:hypothetical protein